jgi:RNA polymerase-binding transcription factor DksA
MIAVNFETYYDRLKNRRNEIIMTLEHVHRERRAVEDNEEWIDQAAYESRVHLLDNLANWYLDEITRIDDALIRIAEGKYRVCVACHEPIGLRRLETTPEAAFCTECQKMRDELSAA